MRYVGIVPLVICLSSCTDMTAVTSISTQLTTASSTWNDVGNEFIASCQRVREVDSAVTDCSSSQQASDGLTKLNGVLAAYFKALGDAANNSNFTIQPGLTDVTTSVGKIPGINQTQVNAASGLFGFLAKWATEALREATVRDLIDQGAPPAQELVGALNSLVVDNLTQQLTGEHIALGSKFGLYIVNQGEKIPDPSNIDTVCAPGIAANFSSGSAYLLTKEYCDRVAVIGTRMKALDDYKKSLSAANDALKALQSNRTDLKGKNLVNQLFNIGSDLNKNIDNVKKAFS